MFVFKAIGAIGLIVFPDPITTAAGIGLLASAFSDFLDDISDN